MQITEEAHKSKYYHEDLMNMNATMRLVVTVACSCLKGKVADDILPHWIEAETHEEAFNNADSLDSYMQSYGMPLFEYLASDWLIDNCMTSYLD